MAAKAASQTTGTNPTQPPPSLVLPPSQFARLQPHEYLLAHLSPSITGSRPSVRANGRYPHQFRPGSVNTGSLTHANGSAVVRIGDSAAVCGVRAEILSTDDIAAWNVFSASEPAGSRLPSGETGSGGKRDGFEIEAYNLLVPNLSLNTGCTPGISTGSAPSPLAQSISQQLLSLLHVSRLVRASDLYIVHHPPDLTAIGPEDMNVDTPKETEAEVKGFWVLYIDVIMISLAGHPLDIAWAAVVAALRNTRIPRAWWDIDHEMILCSDQVSESRTLQLRGLPIASTFAVFQADAAASWRSVIPLEDEEEKAKGPLDQNWILADPDAFEESLCAEHVTIVVDKASKAINSDKMKIIMIDKNGGSIVGIQELKKLVTLANARWAEWKGVLEHATA